MKIIDKCTLNFWKQNKVKFFSVLLCMIFSVSLLMSLLMTFGVFFSSIITSKKNIYGDFMVNISGISVENAQQINQSDKVKSSFYSAPVGFAEYSTNIVQKKYLMILNTDSGFLENMPVNLLSGRLPENENELLLPNHTGDKYKIDDKIMLEIGNRMSDVGVIDTYDFYQNGEYLEINSTKEYTVVGFYEKAIFEDEIYPACIALTSGDIVSDSGNLYVTLKNPYSTQSFVNDLQYDYKTNQELLSCYGVNLNYTQLDLSQLFLIIILLLIVIVISMLFVLNKNIINISLGERRQKLYIRLNQLGVSEKEFYSCSLKESIVLTLISVPVSAVIGLIGTQLILNYLSKATALEIIKNGYNIGFIMFPVLVTGIFVSTANIGFVKSTFRRRKLNNSPKKYTSLNLKNSINDISKKYIKSNKKHMRSMIASVSVCLTMFVSFSCVCNNLNKENELIESNIASDIEFDYYTSVMGDIDYIELYENMKSVKNITDSNFVFTIQGDDNSTLLCTFDDNYFKKCFNNSEAVFIDKTGNISENHVSGQLVFTRSFPIGDVDESCGVTKFKTEEYTFSFDYSADKILNDKYLGLDTMDFQLILIYPYSTVESFLIESHQAKAGHFYFNSSDANLSFAEMFNYFNKNSYSSHYLKNNQAILQEEKNNYYLIRFFSSVFTIFIFITAIFNLLNITINNIKSRISDYVILYSLGTNKRDIQHMSIYESIFYQIRGTLWAVIPTIVISVAGYLFISNGTHFSPYIPIRELLISLLVFIVINLIAIIMAVNLLEKDKIVGYLKDKSL